MQPPLPLGARPGTTPARRGVFRPGRGDGAPRLDEYEINFQFYLCQAKKCCSTGCPPRYGTQPAGCGGSTPRTRPPLWQNPERRDCTAAPGAGWGMPPPSAGKWPYAGTCGPPAPDALADALWSSGARVWKAGLALAAVMCEPNPHETAGHCRPAPGRCLWASPGIQGAVRGAGTTSFDMLV